MLKLSFLSKNIKNIFKNNLLKKEFPDILIYKSFRKIPIRFFSETNKTQESNLTNDNIEPIKKEDKNKSLKEQIYNEDIISPINISIDTKLDSISTSKENSKENDSPNSNSKSPDNENNNKPKDEIEELAKLLPEFYESKMSFRKYKNIVNEYKERLHAELLVNQKISIIFLILN